MDPARRLSFARIRPVGSSGHAGSTPSRLCSPRVTFRSCRPVTCCYHAPGAVQADDTAALAAGRSETATVRGGGHHDNWMVERAMPGHVPSGVHLRHEAERHAGSRTVPSDQHASIRRRGDGHCLLAWLECKPAIPSHSARRVHRHDPRGAGVGAGIQRDADENDAAIREQCSVLDRDPPRGGRLVSPRPRERTAWRKSSDVAERGKVARHKQASDTATAERATAIAATRVELESARNWNVGLGLTSMFGLLALFGGGRR